MEKVNTKKEEIIEEEVELLGPKNDIVFQSLFSKANEEITKNFVSALLDEEIKSITINDTKELFRERPEDKLGILDLQAEVNNKEIIDIEIQLIDRENLEERLLFYFSRLFAMQLKRGDDYTKAKRVVIIAIIDYKLEKTKEIKNMETVWKLIEEKEKMVLTDKIEFRILELGKVKEEYNKNKKSKKAQWMMLVNNPNEVEVRKIMEENKEIKEATVQIRKLTEDEKIREIAWLKQKAILDEKSIFRAGEKRR